jgi:hypothetical protein
VITAAAPSPGAQNMYRAEHVLRQRIVQYFRIEDYLTESAAPEGIQVQHAVAGFFAATCTNVFERRPPA